jgi:S1-C subfamily serine protease
MLSKFLRSLILLPFLWCCGGSPPRLSSAPTPEPSEGTPFTATVALKQDGKIFCAGVWVGRLQVLTARHCVADIEPGDTVTVQDYAGATFPMVLLREEARVDLALLGTPFAPEHVFATLPTSWHVGEPLAIVGHPNRQPWCFFRGYIAAVQEHDAPDDDAGKMQMLWVQAPVWYGNSGGGAFDLDGHLVGIASMRSLQIPDLGWFIAPEEIHAFLTTK